MALRYDFDIVDTMSPQAGREAATARLLSSAGVRRDDPAQRVALFRDRRTALALRSAPKGLRSCFIASGFGLSVFESGLPSGRYQARDETARLDVITRLTENLTRFELPRAEDYPIGDNVFRMGDFVQALAQARPLDPARPAAQAAWGGLAGFASAPLWRKLSLASGGAVLYLMIWRAVQMSGLFGTHPH